MVFFCLTICFPVIGLCITPGTACSQEGAVVIPETVLVEPGSFIMGMDPESSQYGVDGYTGATEFKEAPAHQVTITKPYYMGTYEVTNQEFAEFVDEGGYGVKEYWLIDPADNEPELTGWTWKEMAGRTAPGHTAASWDLSADPYWRDDPYSFHADSPVIGITWYEAYAYCKWLSDATGDTYRLPTEAEWEYAARGPESNIFPWGNEYLSAVQMCGDPGSGAMANCWLSEEQMHQSSLKTDTVWASMELGTGIAQPVGSYPEGVSYWGCHDMAGNVAELTNDWFLGNYYPFRIAAGQTVDPAGPPIALPPFYIPVPLFWMDPARTQRSTGYKLDPVGADNYSPYGATYPLRCSHRMFGFRFMGSSMVGFRILKEAE